MGSRFGSCQNCGRTGTDKSGSPLNIYECGDCNKIFCGYCSPGKGGLIIRTFKCPSCDSDSTSNIGETGGA
jgi:hypothetical protein